MGEAFRQSDRIHEETPPFGTTPSRWGQFIDDFNAFIEVDGDDWAKAAAAAGWTTADVLALVWCVAGGRIVEVDEASAVIEDPDGARRVFLAGRWRETGITTMPGGTSMNQPDDAKSAIVRVGDGSPIAPRRFGCRIIRSLNWTAFRLFRECRLKYSS